MFVFTFNKQGIKKVLVVAACLALLAVSAYTVSTAISNAKTKSANASSDIKVATTTDMQVFLAGYGVEIDVETGKVEQGKVPRKFDESFTAFNSVIVQGGFDLAKYKNKKIEKWSFEAPSHNNADKKAYAVVLVYKQKVIGSYLITKPGGEVMPLAKQTMDYQLEE